MNNSIQTILPYFKELINHANSCECSTEHEYSIEDIEQKLQTLERETRKEEIGRMNRFYVSLLRDVVTDQHERMRLKNVYGIDLDLEDTFIRMEELGAKIEKYLDELSHQKEEE